MPATKRGLIVNGAGSVRLVCPECGSGDVVAGTGAAWNVERQEWGLLVVYDARDCNACGAPGIQPIEKNCEGG